MSRLLDLFLASVIHVLIALAAGVPYALLLWLADLPIHAAVSVPAVCGLLFVMMSPTMPFSVGIAAIASAALSLFVWLASDFSGFSSWYVALACIAPFTLLAAMAMAIQIYGRDRSTLIA